MGKNKINEIQSCSEDFYKEIDSIKDEITMEELESYRMVVDSARNTFRLSYPKDAKPGFVYHWVASEINNLSVPGRMEEMAGLYRWRPCICKDYPATAILHGLSPTSNENIKHSGHVMMCLPESYWKIAKEVTNKIAKNLRAQGPKQSRDPSLDYKIEEEYENYYN
jgi:hypothetical protein